MFLFKDHRQNADSSIQSQADHVIEQYQESKQSILEWLSKLEKSLDFSQVELNFIPVLEEKLNHYQVS